MKIDLTEKDIIDACRLLYIITRLEAGSSPSALDKATALQLERRIGKAHDCAKLLTFGLKAKPFYAGPSPEAVQSAIELAKTTPMNSADGPIMATLIHAARCYLDNPIKP